MNASTPRIHCPCVCVFVCWYWYVLVLMVVVVVVACRAEPHTQTETHALAKPVFSVACALASSSAVRPERPTIHTKRPKQRAAATLCCSSNSSRAQKMLHARSVLMCISECAGNYELCIYMSIHMRCIDIVYYMFSIYYTPSCSELPYNMLPYNIQQTTAAPKATNYVQCVRTKYMYVDYICRMSGMVESL